MRTPGIRYTLRLVLMSITVGTMALLATPFAWAGPAAQTLPTAAPSTSVSPAPTTAAATGQRWSFTTARANCVTACTLTEVDPGTLPAAPRAVGFSSAANFAGARDGILRSTLRVCYQTTDRRDRIYYYDQTFKRWIGLRVTVRTSQQVCTNVLFGNVSFAAGH